MARRNKGHATKDALVRVLVTPDLKKKATKLADAADVSLSAWTRGLMLAAVKAADPS